jgi:hypothetical protein
MNLHRKLKFKRLPLLFFGALALFLIAANSGNILSLSASGGANPGEDITISSTVQATSGINNSNLLYTLRASDGTVVASHKFGGVPNMNNGDTFSYSWVVNNGSFPAIGNYSLTLCWSTGNAENCDITSATTTFYAANSLGVMLAVGVAMFLGLVWWKRNDLFEAVKTS